MKYRRIDESGDMLPAFNNKPYEGAEAVGHAIRSRLLSFKGEWWEAPSDGVDIHLMLGTKNNNAVVKAMVLQVVADTEGVLGVESIDINTDTSKRTGSIVVVVRTVYGNTTVEV